MLGKLCSMNVLEAFVGMCSNDLGQITCVYECVYVLVCKMSVFTGKKCTLYMCGEGQIKGDIIVQVDI